MDDRDTFAAAALTGLMRFRGDSGQRGAVWKSTAVIVAEAYDLADAMLRERGDHVPDAGKMAETAGETECPLTAKDLYHIRDVLCRLAELCLGNQMMLGYRRDQLAKAYDGYVRAGTPEETPATTNHDAAPAAKARTDADSARTDKAAPRPGEGTGNTQEPVAWAVIGKERMAGHVIGLYDTVLEARSRVGRMVSHGDIYTADKVEIVPLYRQPQPTLTDEEREAVEAAIIGGCEMSATLRNMLERMA